MIDSPSTNPASEQARLELSVAAAATERANRPRFLIWLGALLVVAACIAMFTALSSRTAESLRLAKARDATDQLERKKAEIDALSANIRARGLESDARMVPKLEALATAAGLKLLGNISDTEDIGNLPGGLTKKLYIARVAPGEDPSAVMNWLATTQDPKIIPWLEISQLRISPAGTDAPGRTGGLSFEVRFSRYEKKEVRR